MLLELIAALACGPLDRLRGHPKHLFGKRIFDKLAYGAAASLAMGYVEPGIVAMIAALLALGMSPGWGAPMGAILGGERMRIELLEWWQIGPMARNPWAAVAGRGVLWGAPLIPLAVYLDAWALLLAMPAMSIAFAVGMVLGPRLRFIEPADAWGRCEWVRGWCAGALLLLIGVFK